jgi:hypothetical protein
VVPGLDLLDPLLAPLGNVARMGFSASTGGSYESHYVLSWRVGPPAAAPAPVGEIPEKKRKPRCKKAKGKSNSKGKGKSTSSAKKGKKPKRKCKKKKGKGKGKGNGKKPSR